MSRVVVLPPENGVRTNGLYAGGWWHETNEPGRIVCDLCPRECHLKPGDRGFCFVRQNVDGEMMLTTYGRSTGFCIDPIEKKPLNHFLPGTSVLSFGTAGCNLGCKFCQNWDISKSREVERLSELAGPEAIAAAAAHFDCRSVAYTYNDPIVWAEYAIDTAKACRAAGIKNVAVTAGYIAPEARQPFYEFMDAANVDLKAFSEEFYYRVTYSHLQPILETLEWLQRETDVWFEITNLVIPQTNDSTDEIRQMCDWISSHLGDGVPMHFTAFHPDFRMRELPNTPPETLIEARQIALNQGLKYVYVGNVNDVVHQSTYCASCGGMLIQRNWYELGEYNLSGNHCRHCGNEVPGVFEATPGDWGRKRLPINMTQFSRPLPIVTNPANSGEEPQPMSSAAQNDSAQKDSAQKDSAQKDSAQKDSAQKDSAQKDSAEKDSAEKDQAKKEGQAARLQAQRPKLTADQEKQVHHAACEVIAAEILGRNVQVPDATLGGAIDRTVMGSFVTLKRKGRLRACCGTLGSPMPLGRALQQAAFRTAKEDTRLPPISPTELSQLDVDVSLLFAFQPVSEKGRDRIGAVEIGRHGLQISRGENAGLLLPNVATEQGYESEEFLRQVCRKAGLPTTAWEDDNTVLQTFETCAIEGPFDKSSLPDEAAVRPLLGPKDLDALAAHTAGNLAALAKGATPSYYAPGCADGSVHGVALSLKIAGSSDAVHFFRFSMRPAMPLQSTTFSLCEAAANALRSGQIRLPSGNVNLGASFLYDPAMHGTVAEPDLIGIDPQRRALLILEAGKSAWVYDPAKTAEELLSTAAEQLHVLTPESAGVFSFAIESTESAISVSNAPQATQGTASRPPAVAGRFYPADADELSQTVKKCLGDPPARRKTCAAIMVPHAGLVYSGNVAGQVFSKVKIPDTVIVISPKHTRVGVEWAVAPHETWSIPGAELASNRELAAKLVAAIPGLQMDAAAHQNEHGIEVELPLLAALNPNVQVVGITIGSGDLQRCKEFATGLAKVLSAEEQPPLLIISSDMNHYASDEENRRLDEIAMLALERLDPDDLFETIQSHNISMCGVLPAVIIMEAIRQMKGLKNVERVAYATSADTSGDKSRVVGYCGMLFQ